MRMCVYVCVQNGSVNVDSVVTVAARLAEAGHYGAERIAIVSSRLQADWKCLTSALEERSNTLAMATGFHQGAEQVMMWEDDAEPPRLPLLTLSGSVCLRSSWLKWRVGFRRVPKGCCRQPPQSWKLLSRSTRS